MKVKKIVNNVVVRNIAGILLLMGLHYLADQGDVVRRTGFSKTSPYLFLALMYGWIVFHNRILFENLYTKNRRVAYFGSTTLAMLLCSLNMHYILRTGFQVDDTIPHILSFWVYTVAGLGIYVIWRYVGKASSNGENKSATNDREEVQQELAAFTCNVDGARQKIRYSEIHYIESMENYVRIITGEKKPVIVRLALKEAEGRLPSPPFIRISRSCIVNREHITSFDGDSIAVRGQVLKVGKVFKRYVEGFLK